MTFPGGWAFASRQFRVAAAKIADARPFPILPALLITGGRLPLFLPPPPSIAVACPELKTHFSSRRLP